MDEYEFADEGDFIGRCFLCKLKIVKSNAWACKSTVSLVGNKICGACLRSLAKPVARAEKLYTQEMKDKDKKEKQIERVGVWVNPETGRIEKA